MRFFTPEEDDFLRENYMTIPTKRMSTVLGRSESSARQRMALIGIVVPEELAEMFKKQSQFKKGSVSFNKGKKMKDYASKEAMERMAKTQFKKGQTPHNTKYDGHERINKDGYTEVRVSIGKYKLKHRVLWEKHHGKIPKNHIVVFKDKDKNNFELNNLELITFEENMSRNTIQRYPKELKHVIKLSHKLKRKLNEKLNH